MSIISAIKLTAEVMIIMVCCITLAWIVIDMLSRGLIYCKKKFNKNKEAKQ